MKSEWIKFKINCKTNKNILHFETENSRNFFFFEEKGYLFKWGKEIFSEKRDLFCIVVKVFLRINIKHNFIYSTCYIKIRKRSIKYEMVSLSV